MTSTRPVLVTARVGGRSDFGPGARPATSQPHWLKGKSLRRGLPGNKASRLGNRKQPQPLEPARRKDCSSGWASLMEWPGWELPSLSGCGGPSLGWRGFKSSSTHTPPGTAADGRKALPALRALFLQRAVWLQTRVTTRTTRWLATGVKKTHQGLGTSKASAGGGRKTAKASTAGRSRNSQREEQAVKSGFERKTLRDPPFWRHSTRSSGARLSFPREGRPPCPDWVRLVFVGWGGAGLTHSCSWRVKSTALAACCRQLSLGRICPLSGGAWPGDLAPSGHSAVSGDSMSITLQRCAAASSG